jgi:hypothetical protein
MAVENLAGNQGGADERGAWVQELESQDKYRTGENKYIDAPSFSKK